jgi:hypothetical protein
MARPKTGGRRDVQAADEARERRRSQLPGEVVTGRAGGDQHHDAHDACHDRDDRVGRVEDAIGGPTA